MQENTKLTWEHIPYTYCDDTWGDLLTAYNGVPRTYDPIGNLLTDGTWTYTWRNGRELASMTDGTTTWSYTYDANGMRTQRSNGTKTYNYVYNGSQLTQMTVGNDTLFFTYGALGPNSVTWNGTTYYYSLNAQGDVIGIFDNDGKCLVSYNWDNAWGYNPIPEGRLASTLGVLNPLRYRGYVYDTETGYYYLQSRYYDPEVGRWINVDLIIDVNDFGGHNLFVYCDNNPVNKVDYTGNDGIYIELGNGWYCRIDSQDTTTQTQRHIHIWNSRKGISYAQNEDGSPHDKNNNGKGKLPRWLQKTIQNKTGWDYNGKRSSFFGKTEYKCWAEGIKYTFADGTTVFEKYSLFRRISFSVDSYEGLYYKNRSASSGASAITRTYYLPIFGPIALPLFSFGFGWSLLPIPLLY